MDGIATERIEPGQAVTMDSRTGRVSLAEPAKIPKLSPQDRLAMARDGEVFIGKDGKRIDPRCVGPIEADAPCVIGEEE